MINLKTVKRIDRPVAGLQLSKVAWFLLAIGLIGVAARLSLWWVSTGTVDVKNWRRFGEEIANHGLAWTYASDERFNHPPLIGLYVGAMWDITGGDPANFARLLKVPALIGEAIAIFALTRRLGAPAFAAYATAPAAILVSSYHGNTDSLYIAFILLAALAFQNERFFWAGLLFGAALNVKLLPLVLLPLLLIAAPSRRALARMVAGLAIGTIPYLPLIVTSASDMYRNMLAYNSTHIEWGFLAFLNPAKRQEELTPYFDPIRDAFIASGRYLIIAAILILAWACRRHLRLPMVEQLALGGAIFLFLAPGFGMQYVALIAPLLVLVDIRWAVAWSWLAGLFIGIRYSVPYLTGKSIHSWHNFRFNELALGVGVLTWALLALFLWHRLVPAIRAWRRAVS